MKQVITGLIGAALLSCAADVQGADEGRDQACRKIENQIRKIESRMRRPYTAAQGVRFDERLRELRERRYRRCR